MNQRELEWALDQLKRAADEKMYAALTFQFVNGKLQHVKTEKTEKPPVDAEVKAR